MAGPHFHPHTQPRQASFHTGGSCTLDSSKVNQYGSMPDRTTWCVIYRRRFRCRCFFGVELPMGMIPCCWEKIEKGSAKSKFSRGGILRRQNVIRNFSTDINETDIFLDLRLQMQFCDGHFVFAVVPMSEKSGKLSQLSLDCVNVFNVPVTWI